MGDCDDPATAPSGAGDDLLALGPVPPPAIASSKPGVVGAKRVIRRATVWQLEPLLVRIEELQRRTATAVDELERRIAALELNAAYVETRLVPLVEDAVSAAHAADRDLLRAVDRLGARLDALESGTVEGDA